MHIRVVAVGTRQPAWVHQACRLYTMRLPKNWGFALIEVEQGKSSRSDPDFQARRLLGHVRPADTLITLDEHGLRLSSIEFAQRLGNWTQAGRDIVFAIGGAEGLGTLATERADHSLSLGSMTFAHGLARIMLLEQLYRAHTLLAGHPYHRG